MMIFPCMLHKPKTLRFAGRRFFFSFSESTGHFLDLGHIPYFFYGNGEDKFLRTSAAGSVFLKLVSEKIVASLALH